ncbi:hypothetical protein C8R46DRAFT_1194745 [Mycena filopes]|nr:hypothetical protein C8R46DRAFT_1194745 [Mycena filopes]
MSTNSENGGDGSDDGPPGASNTIFVEQRKKLNERSPLKRAEMVKQLAAAQEQVRRAQQEEARVAMDTKVASEEHRDEGVGQSEDPDNDPGCDACRHRGVPCVTGRDLTSCRRCKEKKVRCTLVPPQLAGKRPNRREELRRARQGGAKLALNKRRRDSSVDSESHHKRPRSLHKWQRPRADAPETRIRDVRDYRFSDLERKLQRLEQKLEEPEGRIKKLEEREKRNKAVLSVHRHRIRQLSQFVLKATEEPRMVSRVFETTHDLLDFLWEELEDVQSEVDRLAKSKCNHQEAHMEIMRRPRRRVLRRIESPELEGGDDVPINEQHRESGA